MTVFFQHVGDQNSARDFPKTVGVGNTVRRLAKDQLANFAPLIAPDIDGFQIWGIPTGAARIHERLQPGDWFLLVGTLGGGGGVEYVGKVQHVCADPQPEFSHFLWGEDRFPWIFALNGEMLHVPWPEFLAGIRYQPNFDPRGRTFGIAKSRLRSLGYQSDFELIDALRSGNFGRSQ